MMEVNSVQESAVKDEQSDEDDITVLEDDGDDGSTAKKVSHQNQEQDQFSSGSGSRVREYTVQEIAEEDLSSSEARQDPNAATGDSDSGISSFPVSLDPSMDQGGWSWNRDSEVLHGSNDVQPTPRGRRVRRFQCGICGTNFTLLKNAKRHYRCQHLNFHFWCKYCPNGKLNKRYTRRECLEEHFLSHHPEIMCEVAETGSSLRSDEYNILSVDIYEEEDEEEEVGVEMVTTTDSNLQGRATLEDVPRGAFDNSLLLQQEDHMETRRNGDLPRGSFINLAEYHGFANEPQPLSSSPSGSAQKRSQQGSPVSGQAKKVQRVDKDASSLLETDTMRKDDMVLERGEGQSSNRWVSQSDQTRPLRHIRGQSARQGDSFDAQALFGASSANAQDCLLVGSAITQPAKTVTAEKDTSRTPFPTASLPRNDTLNQMPQAASSSSKRPQIQTSMVQTMHPQKQPRSSGYASNIGRSVAEEGNIVNSSSDAPLDRAQSKRPSVPQHAKVVLKDIDSSSSMSCKTILAKYKGNIGRYSKEINYKYDSSGKVVRRKTVRHTFVFNNSESQSTDDIKTDLQIPERGTSR